VPGPAGRSQQAQPSEPTIHERAFLYQFFGKAEAPDTWTADAACPAASPVLYAVTAKAETLLGGGPRPGEPDDPLAERALLWYAHSPSASPARPLRVRAAARTRRSARDHARGRERGRVTEIPDSAITALAVQLAALRDQVHMLTRRLDQAGLKGDLDLAARFEELACTVAHALDAASPRGPAAPYWLDLDREAYAAQLAELRRWVDTVLRPNYGGYELRDCWPSHIHIIWELSTLAAEWHHTYNGQRPDLPRALEFYDRWLPGTMRRVNEFTRACVGQCSLSRRLSYDWTTR